MPRETGVRTDPLDQKFWRVAGEVLDQYNRTDSENDDQQKSEQLVAEGSQGDDYTESDVADGPGIRLVTVLLLGLLVNLVDRVAEHADDEQQNDGVHVIIL